MKKLFQTALAALTIGSSTVALALPVYETSFEAGEGFSAGAFSTADARWAVESSTVSVASGSAFEGDQYVELGAGAVLDFDLTQSDTDAAGDVVFVEGYFRGAGSDQTLDNANWPLTGASAIVHFSSAEGIQVLDGDGTGSINPQNVVSTNVTLGQANETNWFKITIRLDFTDQTWDIWVDNDQKNQSPLGFRDNTVTSLNGFKNLAQGGSGFDAFRIVSEVVGDANGDGVVDVADITRLIEFLTNPPSDDPILFSNADIPNQGSKDGTIDQDDLTRLQAMILGMM